MICVPYFFHHAIGLKAHQLLIQCEKFDALWLETTKPSQRYTQFVSSTLGAPLYKGKHQKFTHKTRRIKWGGTQGIWNSSPQTKWSVPIVLYNLYHPPPFLDHLLCWRTSSARLRRSTASHSQPGPATLNANWNELVPIPSQWHTNANFIYTECDLT